MPDPSAARHSGDDYGEALFGLLPTGRAWPRDPESTLAKVVAGLGQVWGDQVDARAADLLEAETDPRYTISMLPDWERAFGLPDACLDEPVTIEARRAALLQRMTEAGGQSREFFYSVAALLGYSIRIVEYSPFMAGISEAGDTRPDAESDFHWRVGPPEMRFYWTIKVLDARLSWFRAGSGQAGVDPHLRIALATDLECILRRYKPAHSDIAFDYAGLTGAGPMAGTP